MSASSAVPRRYNSAQRVFIFPPALTNSVTSSSRCTMRRSSVMFVRMDSVKLSCGPSTTCSTSGLPMVRFSNPRTSITQASVQPSHSSAHCPLSTSARISSTLSFVLTGRMDTAFFIRNAMRSSSGMSPPASWGRSMQGLRMFSSMSLAETMPSMATIADSNAPLMNLRTITSALTGAFSRLLKTSRLRESEASSVTASSMLSVLPPVSSRYSLAWQGKYAQGLYTSDQLSNLYEFFKRNQLFCLILWHFGRSCVILVVSIRWICLRVYDDHLEEGYPMQLTVRQPSASADAKHYTTERLRSEYVIETVFAPDEAMLTYSHFDRIIAGGVMPVTKAVELVGCKELCSDTFLERREMGVINIGGKGKITVDGVVYELKQYDGLYVGMGAKEIRMESEDGANPAKFYINTCPAHKTYPNVHIDIDKANKRPLGSSETCNKRVINQYIHPAVMQSCQLCMGMTQLAPGSNWNSMPCHTHERRMEVYFYFDVKDENVIFHMMGEPKETRHVILHNEQAVISPSWSIHTGVGTSNYTFIWGMCGENQEFDDMDNLSPLDLL